MCDHEYVRGCDCRDCAIIARDEALEILHRAEHALIAAWADAWYRTGTIRMTKGDALKKAMDKYEHEISMIAPYT